MTGRAAVIGGGTAGLMAAEVLLERGVAVDIYDAMPSLGRKFLMAGKSGLNLTHSEPAAAFLQRFGDARERLEPALSAFDAAAIRAWAAGLGIETFIGSSGRVFPVNFKAAPLLRSWLRRLRERGARIHVRHKWHGWSADGALVFATPRGEVRQSADATVLALGGGSWPKLGSDAAWVGILSAVGVQVAPLKPANCGFDVPWSTIFRERFSGEPVKAVRLSHRERSLVGEFVVTDNGIEGGAVYALSAVLRDRIEVDGGTTLILDLSPDRSEARLAADLAGPRGSRSVTTHLKRQAGLVGVKAGLLRECLDASAFADPARLAAGIKALPLRLTAARPLEEAISSAGGIAFAMLDDRFMLRTRPGLFCAGEMLDWEAPTGGYLFSACFATGRAAGLGAADWLAARSNTLAAAPSIGINPTALG
ncbi:MAG: TIGR03862 family flavoprotein [Alphaproteobacteria bacterium]|nr:TIGR03862 family flavoprotein [Alphaproteobacteria bacterium]